MILITARSNYAFFLRKQMFNGIVIGLEFDIYEVLLNMYCYSQSEFQDGCHHSTKFNHKHFPVLSSFMIYYRVCNQINMTGATSGAGTAYPFGAPEFTPGFQWGSCYSLVLYVCFVGRCLSFCTFSFGHCVVCSSSIYGF